MKAVLCVLVALGIIGLALHELGNTKGTPSDIAVHEELAPFGPAPGSSGAVVDKQLGVTPALLLFMSYQSNEVAADNTYKGRRFVVQGMIASIDKDFSDNIVLRLRTPNEFTSIQAYMDETSATRTAALQKGDGVNLLCTGGGMIIGSPILKNCSFYDAPKSAAPSNALVAETQPVASVSVPESEPDYPAHNSVSASAPIVGQEASMTAPVVLVQPEPEYTEEARADKLSGNVLVSVMVDVDGSPKDIKVVRGLGEGLDEKAVKAVSGYKFKPGIRDGQPVPVVMNIEVNFQIF